jgi:hypothetical protein
MTHVAVPVESVLALHVSAPFKVKVTGSFTMGSPVDESVKMAETGVGDEKLPEKGWIARAVGVAETTVGDAATSIWSSTERPKRAPECVLICWSTLLEAMSTFQTSPEVESPVQNELPSGSRLMANSEPWHPGNELQV